MVTGEDLEIQDIAKHIIMNFLSINVTLQACMECEPRLYCNLIERVAMTKPALSGLNHQYSTKKLYLNISSGFFVFFFFLEIFLKKT